MSHIGTRNFILQSTHWQTTYRGEGAEGLAPQEISSIVFLKAQQQFVPATTSGTHLTLGNHADNSFQSHPAAKRAFASLHPCTFHCCGLASFQSASIGGGQFCLVSAWGVMRWILMFVIELPVPAASCLALYISQNWPCILTYKVLLGMVTHAEM